MHFSEITDIRHRDEGFLTGDIFEIESASGITFKIEIAWANGGETFKNVLMRTWQPARKGDYDRAIAEYDSAIRLNPDDAGAFRNRGVAYRRKGDYDRAIADFDTAIRLDPKDALAFMNRGILYDEDKGAHDRAIADYDTAIQLNPDYAFAFTVRGIAYGRKGDYDRAIADFDTVIRLKPDYALAFKNRGNNYRAKGDYDRAIADYDSAIRLKPDDAGAFNIRGEAYRRNGEYDRAIADYDQAIKLKPNFSTALNNKAWALATAHTANVRDGPEAVRLAQKAVALQDESSFRDTLAAAYAEAGRFDDAVTEEERAIEMLRAAGEHEAVADLQSRLDLYKRGRPYRE